MSEVYYTANKKQNTPRIWIYSICMDDRGGEVTSCQLMQWNIPEVFHLQQHHCENFKPCEKEG
jgi:hypothetical protein